MKMTAPKPKTYHGLVWKLGSQHSQDWCKKGEYDCKKAVDTQGGKHHVSLDCLQDFRTSCQDLLISSPAFMLQLLRIKLVPIQIQTLFCCRQIHMRKCNRFKVK